MPPLERERWGLAGSVSFLPLAVQVTAEGTERRTPCSLSLSRQGGWAVPPAPRREGQVNIAFPLWGDDGPTWGAGRW